MNINITPKEMPAHIVGKYFLVEVNEIPFGFIHAESVGGSKMNWLGIIGQTKVFTGIRSEKAARTEMVKHISELHRKWTRKGNPLDQSQNPFRVDSGPKMHRAFGIAKPAPIITEITSK
jgi:hypothetical protein